MKFLRNTIIILIFLFPISHSFANVTFKQQLLFFEDQQNINGLAFNEDGSTKTNYSGGVQGGISNGMDINFNVAFKPVSTIMRDQDSIDSKGNKVKVQGKGRHDPCVVPRAVPIVEAIAALVLADYLLLSKLSKI